MFKENWSIVSMFIENLDVFSLSYVDEYYKRNILHYLAGNGNFDLVKIIVGKGVKPNMKDKFKKTPARYAEENGHKEMAKWLRAQYR